jgi:hypothetical protein
MPSGLLRRPSLGGFFLPAHLWAGSPGEVICHPLDPPGYATLRGSGPEQRLGALKDSEADDCWRTKWSNGHVMLSC